MSDSGNVSLEKEQSSGFPAVAVIQSVFLAMVMVVGAIANSFICRCILAHRSLRTNTNSFIFNLAATDFLLSVLCMPFALVSAITGMWVFGKVMCVLTGFLLSVLCIASILTLALVAIDRYLAICRPLKYCTLITQRSSLTMIVYVWFHAAICAILPVLGWGEGYFFVPGESICRPSFGKPSVDNGYTIFLFIACFVAPFSIIAFTYVSILCTASRQFRRVHHHKGNQVGNVENLQPSNSQFNCETTFARSPENTVIADEITSATNTSRAKKLYAPKAIRNRRRQKARGFKMLWIIVVVFLICWSPYFVMIFYSSVRHQSFPDSVKVPMMLLTFLNSALNPFLYGFLNSKFRDSLRNFLGQNLTFCKCAKQTVQESRVFHLS
ncbi:hypothetical protein ACROYT_G018179 [Oculina patagonica]